ncbi:MAG: Cache 3/Cache 2 fusion domain-containing protein [Candidatus Omnitrophota bacterium]
MFNVLKNRNLNVKVSLLGAGSALITAISLVLLAVWQSGQYSRLAQTEVDQLIRADLDHITQGIYNLVKIGDETVQERVNYNLNVARLLLSNAGGISLSQEEAAWTAVNQFTDERIDIRLPKMSIGGQWLGQNSDPNVKTAVVDEVMHLVGETCTIFQRMNEKGDMLRVATTVRNASNERAIGTYIPAINPDGAPNPVIASVLRGETYRGRAFVVNAWHLTAYEPIYTEAGVLLGMLYVGVEQESVVSRIRQTILQTKIGKTGYVYVLGGKGRERGLYIISQSGKRDGEDIWDSKDSDGNYMVRAIIHTAIVLQPGELGAERYRWQNPGEPAPRWKIARLAYYEPWDWVIGTSVYEDEMEYYYSVLSHGRMRMTRIMSMAGLAITLIIIAIGILIAWTIVRPIRQIKNSVETIIRGDLDQTFEIQSHDEIGALAQTFNLMTNRLKQTLDGLRQSEEKYRHIFENSLEGLFQTSLEGHFLNASPAMAQILGYDSPEEIIETVTDIRNQVYVDPEERDRLLSLLLDEGVIRGREIQYCCKDKKKIWVSLSARIVRGEYGQPSFIQGFVIDITERKRLEEQLLQSQKMDAVGQLAGGIAHDFNNLLTIISGYSELVFNKLAQNDPLRDKLKEIINAAERASSLTKQLLVFSRKQVFQPVIVNLNELILNMEKMLRRLIGEHIELTASLSRESGCLKADPTQIEQIVMNLAINARDAMPSGGKLTIETANADLDDTFCSTHAEVQTGSYVMLSISDNGCGMDKETLSQIFNPFFTTKEKGKGTGLGLSTVYGIVKQSSGHIFAYSEPKCGTTFKIYFPRLDERASPHPMKLMGEETLRGDETVLLVEDEEAVRNTVSEILADSGYAVLPARNGQEALELCKTRQDDIQLLITDVVMPDMSGVETSQRLSQMRPDIKILFMSGYTDNAILRHGILDESVAFIQKPFTPDNLLRKVREVLTK